MLVATHLYVFVPYIGSILCPLARWRNPSKVGSPTARFGFLTCTISGFLQALPEAPRPEPNPHNRASAVVTVSLSISLVLLIWRLPGHKETPAQLLRAAGALWICNLLIFACWYWRLDAGGPHQRALRRSHTDGAFLFPQMVLDPDLRREMGEDQWRPGFVDYLFLAFNTSTAFSPTDVPVLSRWAKVLMMLQATISLGTIAILAARAVNIL